MHDVSAPLARLPDDPLATAADADFPIALRGYDREAVDAYVQRTSALVAELHATRSPELAVRRALERVGEEVTGVLARAHETAEQITSQSRREADERLRHATRDAEQIVVDARRRLTTLDADTDRVWDERQRIVEDLRELAAELLHVADTATARLAPAEEPEPDREAPTSEGPASAKPANERPARAAEPATELLETAERSTEVHTIAPVSHAARDKRAATKSSKP